MSTDLPIQMFNRRDVVNNVRGARNHRADIAYTAILLRLPVELLAHMDAAAKAGYRSRTAEVIQRLLKSIEGESIDEHGVIVVHSKTSIK